MSLLVFSFSVYSQNNSSSQNAVQETNAASTIEANLESTGTNNNLTEEMPLLDELPETSQSSQSKKNDFSESQSPFLGIGAFIRMIIVLIIVLVIIFVLFSYLKKSMGITPNNDTDPFLRKVASLSLSPGKSIHVVTILDNAYLVGVTDNAVNLIGQISDKELVEAMNVYADKHDGSRKPKNFEEVLSLFMPNGFKMTQKENLKNKNQKGSLYEDSEDFAKNMFKKQHDRLNSLNSENEHDNKL